MHKRHKPLTPRQRIARRIVNQTKRWLPILVLITFIIGGGASFFVAHGQDSLTLQNAVKIAELKADMHDVIKDVTDMKDMPIQMGAMRERVIKIESSLAQIQKQLDGMDTKGNWFIFLVFGTLAGQILKSFKFGAHDAESNDRVPLIKP